MTGTCLTGNGFCRKRDTNLFGQLIHILSCFFSSVDPAPGLRQALLMWAEERGAGRFNPSLSKMNVLRGISVGTKNRPEAPSLGLQPAPLRNVLMILTYRKD